MPSRPTYDHEKDKGDITESGSDRAEVTEVTEIGYDDKSDKNYTTARVEPVEEKYAAYDSASLKEVEGVGHRDVFDIVSIAQRVSHRPETDCLAPSMQSGEQLAYNEAGEMGQKMRITGKDLEEAEEYAKTMSVEDVNGVSNSIFWAQLRLD